MSSFIHRRRVYFYNVDAVAHELSNRYSDHSHENKTNPLSELLFILCSLQTNEALYHSTYASLRARFPTFRHLAEAKEVEIASVIAHGGLSRQKARTIRAIIKTCSACGMVKDEMPLSERTYHCNGCGLVLDRDVNAARNLLSLSSASSARFEACGDSPLGGSVKQEPSIMNNE